MIIENAIMIILILLLLLLLPQTITQEEVFSLDLVECHVAGW